MFTCINTIKLNLRSKVVEVESAKRIRPKMGGDGFSTGYEILITSWFESMEIRVEVGIHKKGFSITAQGLRLKESVHYSLHQLLYYLLHQRTTKNIEQSTLKEYLVGGWGGALKQAKV